MSDQKLTWSKKGVERMEYWTVAEGMAIRHQRRRRANAGMDE